MWFADGLIVDDIYERSIDAPYIFDDGVDVGGEQVGWNDLLWRECLIPVAEFDFPFVSLEQHLLAITAETAVSQRERGQEVAGWMAAVGGVEKALLAAPLLVTLRDGKVTIEDGYHRLGVAVILHDARFVRALCSDMTLRPRPSPGCAM
jgi:hypothetical protein